MSSFYLTREMLSLDIAEKAKVADEKKFFEQINEVCEKVISDQNPAEELYFFFLRFFNAVCGIPFKKFPEYRSGCYDQYLLEMLQAFQVWIQVAGITDNKVLSVIESSIRDNKNQNRQLPVGNWTDYIGQCNRFQTVCFQKAVKEMTAIVNVYSYYGLKELDKETTKALYQGMLDFVKSRVRDSMNVAPPEEFWEDKHRPDSSVIEDFYHWSRITRPAPSKQFDRSLVFFSPKDQEAIEKAFRHFIWLGT